MAVPSAKGSSKMDPKDFFSEYGEARYIIKVRILLMDRISRRALVLFERPTVCLTPVGLMHGCTRVVPGPGSPRFRMPCITL